MVEPIPFDDEIILGAEILTLSIFIDDLHSEPHQCLVVNGEFFFEINEELRDSIYGQVVLGMILQPLDEEGRTFERAGDLVAIKISDWVSFICYLII